VSADDEVHAARAAYSGGDWRAAYDSFGQAHDVAELATEDLSSYGMAAWRLGYGRESIQLCERAFNRLIADNDTQCAAMKAVEVALQWFNGGERPPAAGDVSGGSGMGSLGDRIGHKKLLLWGVIGFGAMLRREEIV